MFRVGIGQDSHKIKNNNNGLILGGVKISDEYGVKANSDGDIVLHSLVNALSSAIGDGSISFYADPLVKKGIINSEVFVERVMREVKKKGFKVNNVSIAIEGDEPKLEGFLKEMGEKISKMVEVKRGAVGITVTSGEGLTSFGKGEGIQAFVIVSLTSDE